MKRDDFTYREVGASAGELPAGYRHIHHRVFLGENGQIFNKATEALLTWHMRRKAGITVNPTNPKPVPGANIMLRLGWLGWTIQAPCRIVYVINEVDRRGFAYGTLPGHPECGEEAFSVFRDKAGRAYFEVRAFSRPGSPAARLAGAAGRLAQDAMTRRYLRAIRALSDET